MFLASLDGLVGERTEGRRVVRVSAVVAVDVHVAIAVCGIEGFERAVDGDLLVVAAQAVAVRVRVGEETGLKDWVGGGLDTGDHVRGGESGLFNLREVVLRILVQGEAAKSPQRHLLLGPDFGEVEDVPTELLGLFGAQDLHVAGPGGVLAALDGLE